MYPMLKIPISGSYMRISPDRKIQHKASIAGA